MEKQTLRPKVQLNEVRKKRLMRRLHQIKLNKSRSHSFLDAYYETKLRKLKNNNSSLAKSLAEQRQISNQWYEECLLAKADIHDKEQKLLRYQIIEDGHFERAVEVEMVKRLKTFAEPMESSINTSLDSCLSLCKHLSKMKQVFHTLVRCDENGRNLRSSSYPRNSRGSIGPRPPLCKNGASKSPRKNVVHPMVEGHVIGPAQICLPRVSLEDRYRYRLQERAERLEEQGNNMSAISENSTAINEESPDSETIVDPFEEIEPMESSNESRINLSDGNGNQTETSSSSVVQNDRSNPEIAREHSSSEDSFPISLPCLQESENNADSSGYIENFLKNSTKYQKPSESNKNNELTVDIARELSSVNTCLVSTSPCLDISKETSHSLDCRDNFQDNSPKYKETSRLSKNKKRTSIKEPLSNGDDLIEDPLEGPSWLHLTKKRGRKCQKRKQASLPPLQPLGTVRLVLEVSSDEDVDLDIGSRKKKKLPLKPTFNLCLSPTKREPPLYKPEDLEIRIGRRSKKKSRVNETRRNDEDKLSNLHPLDSFIVNDTLICEGDYRSPDDKHWSENSVKTVFAKLNSPPIVSIPQVLGNNTNNPYLVHEKENLRKLCNVTCFLNSSMEITECLTKDLINNMIEHEPKVDDLKDMDSNLPHRILAKCDKPKKFFKASEEENFKSNKGILSDKTPFDASLIEPSFHFEPSSKPVKKCDNSSPSITNELNELIDTSLNVNLFLEQNDLVSDSFTSITKGKENVPPIKEELVHCDESALKLRNVTIVVQDILKSPVGEDNEVYIVKNNSEGCERKRSPYCSRWFPTRKRGNRSSGSLNGQRKLTNCAVKSACCTSLNPSELDIDILPEEKSMAKKNSRRKMVVKLLIDENILTAEPFQELPNKKINPKLKSVSRRKRQKNTTDVDCSENLENNGNSMVITEEKLNCNGDIYLKESRCKDKSYLGITLSPINLESLVSNPFEENLSGSTNLSTPSGFEGFPIHEKKLLASTELPRLLAQKIGFPVNDVSEILGDEIMKAHNDEIIYIEPLMVDLEDEDSEDEKIVEHDPLSAVQLPLSHSVKVPEDNIRINGENGLISGVENNCEVFDIHTANLIGEYLPRCRRAASKITSFKEPSLHKKLRNEKETKRGKGRKRGSKL